jgi:hypothetical protein
MKETEADHKSSSETKREFRKVTITLPPDIYERLIQESARRKIAGAPNQMLSALFREALSQYLERLR